MGQMKVVFLIPLTILAASVSAADKRSCELQDDDLLECPSIEAPPVTELRNAFVELVYTVQANGSVTDIRVVESGGDKRWIDAAVTAVSRWKYRISYGPVLKTRRFVFELED